jgi:hypothetical protein
MRRRKTLVVLAAAAAGGAALAAVKGQGADIRDAIGNMSAPWLLIAFLAGATSRTWKGGAVAGLASTLAALVGFYAAESVILDLGPHSWAVDLQLTLRAGRYYFAQGILSGPLFGALGGLWASKRSAAAAMVVALAFVFEPLVVWAYQRGTALQGNRGALTHYPLVWVTEVCLGVAGIVLIAIKLITKDAKLKVR